MIAEMPLPDPVGDRHQVPLRLIGQIVDAPVMSQVAE
jgi:hypothetical protein